MKIKQSQWSEAKGWDNLPAQADEKVQLVFIFGATSILKKSQFLPSIKKAYPKAVLLGCSTAGEILGTRVFDDTLIVTAVQFEYTKISFASVNIDNPKNSQAAGEQLASLVDKKGLVHLFVLSDGLKVNGTDLVSGLVKQLPSQVAVTGGLSGDGADFKETLVFSKNGLPESGVVSAIGFYGDRLKIGYGSLGGWDPFGPERLVTSSDGNVLYQLDGQSALELYKKYLGDHASGLPATGLLFPLNLKMGEKETPVVRTILAVNEKEQSMTFAGTMPQGATIRMMKANFDRLIDGAAGAAKVSYQSVGSKTPDLAILISCVGRKLILKQRIEEEVESVRDILGERAVLTGFYSYGEISPFTPGAKCELHNQTMTITTFSEV